MSKFRLFSRADLQLEVVILIIAGLIVSITGILLFPVATGSLPYYENGLYGLLLVMFALQIVSLGKTPFGDMNRSWLLVTAGIAVAAVGIVTCFVPDIFSEIPRLLLMLFFGPGGFLLFMQMVLSRDRLTNWLKYGGIFRHLIAGCSLVYLLSMVIALLLLNRNLLTTQATAAVVLAYGVSIIYLALVLRKIYLAYPQAEKKGGERVDLPMDRAMILLTGVFMVLLGLLLIPVNLGILPFSGSAQLGLLMVFFSVQMLASGSTPIGPFPRTWLMILLGLLFAALGTISCVIPEILVSPADRSYRYSKHPWRSDQSGKVCFSEPERQRKTAGFATSDRTQTRVDSTCSEPSFDSVRDFDADFISPSRSRYRHSIDGQRSGTAVSAVHSLGHRQDEQSCGEHQIVSV